MSEFEKELIHRLARRDTLSGPFYYAADALIETFKDWQPHKPLVVVPQIIADAIESIPDYYSAYGAIKLIDMKLTELPLENEDWKYVHDWIFVDDNANKFVKAYLDGYTVEKEKKYYLCEKNTGYYLTKKSDTLKLVVNPYFDETNEFTQSEIDKLNIGSYEQIEVEP